MSAVGGDLINKGKLFHRQGAVIAKAWSPWSLRLAHGMAKRPRSDDLSGLDVT